MYKSAGVISYTNTSLELHTANDLVLNGSNIISGTAGNKNGYLRLKINGTYYKIQLLDDIYTSEDLKPYPIGGAMVQRCKNISML